MSENERLIIVPRRLYATRTGLKVCIYRMDGSKPYIIHGGVLDPDGWESVCWTESGQHMDCIEGNDWDITRTWDERSVPTSLDPECSKGMSKEMFEDCLGAKWLVLPERVSIRVKFKGWHPQYERTRLAFFAMDTSGKRIDNCFIDAGWMTVQRAKNKQPIDMEALSREPKQ